MNWHSPPEPLSEPRRELAAVAAVLPGVETELEVAPAQQRSMASPLLLEPLVVVVAAPVELVVVVERQLQ